MVAPILEQVGITTSEQLVKSLKSSYDPPISPHPWTKIQLASLSWDDTSFFVPKKDELLSDWIVETLCRSAKSHLSTNSVNNSTRKNKGKARELEPTLDCYLFEPDYWKLLLRIIQPDQPGSSSKSSSSWINSLASKHPILTLASIFAQKLTGNTELPGRLLEPASRVLKCLLGPAASRAAALSVESDVAGVAEVLVQSWSIAMEYGGNSRKNSKFFLSDVLPAYVKALRPLSLCTREDPGVSDLLQTLNRFSTDSIFTTENLFNLLKGQDSAEDHSRKGDPDLLSSLTPLCLASDEDIATSALAAIPSLFAQLVGRFRAEIPTLFPAAANIGSTAKSVAASQHLQQVKLRSSALKTFILPVSRILTTKPLPRSRESPVITLQKARSRALLVKSIKDLDIYVPGGEDSNDWTRILFEFVKDSIELIKDGGDEVLSKLALEALTSIWQLEQASIESQVDEVFFLLSTLSNHSAKQSGTSFAAVAFLRTITASFSRNRDLPGLIKLLLSAFEKSCEASDGGDLHSKTIKASVLLSSEFNGILSKAIQDFLMPMQVVPLLEDLRNHAGKLTPLLRRSFGHPNTDSTYRNQSGASKRQRLSLSNESSFTSSMGLNEAASKALIFLETIAIVIRNVPLVKTIRADAIRAVKELHQEVILVCIDLGSFADSDNDILSVRQALLTCALSTRHWLLCRNWQFDPEPSSSEMEAKSGFPDCFDSDLDERKATLMDICGSSISLPEARIEILRALLQRAELDLIRGRKRSDYLRIFSEANSVPAEMFIDGLCAGDKQTEAWDGQSHAHSGSSAYSSALWILATVHKAEFLDAVASHSLLSAFSGILLDSCPHGGLPDLLSWLSMQTSRNAHFLELPRWRSSILSVAMARTDGLIGTRSMLVDLLQRKSGKIFLDKVGLPDPKDIISALRAMLAISNFPAEWFPLSSKSAILERALLLDAYISFQHLQYRAFGLSEQSFYSSWCGLRSFIQHFFKGQGNFADFPQSLVADSLANLITSMLGLESQISLVETSLGAFKTGVFELIKDSRNESGKGGSHSILYVHRRLQECLTLAASPDSIYLIKNADSMLLELALEDESSFVESELAINWSGSSITEQLEIITREEAPLALKAMDDAVEKHRFAAPTLLARGIRLKLSLEKASSPQPTEHLEGKVSQILDALCCIAQKACVETYNAKSLGKVLPQPLNDLFSETMQAMIACESYMPNLSEASSSPIFKAVMAFSAFISSLGGEDIPQKLQIILTRTTSRMDPATYEEAMARLTLLIAGTFSDDEPMGQESSLMDSRAVIITMGLLIRHGPEGTSTAARKHLTRLLSLISLGNEKAGMVILAELQMIEDICTNKAMLLRPIDVGLILSLFSRIVGPRSPHFAGKNMPGSDFGPRIFLCIVSAMASIIRLRQDLLSSHMPNLAGLLSQIFRLFQRLKPSVGGAQQRSVRETLPEWLDPLERPLGVSEARSFSRLLMSLTAKSATLGPSLAASKKKNGQTRKSTESLAKPFSKHAIHVLVAYIRTLTAPITEIPTDVRTEIQLGLLSICEIVGEHERDAAMVGSLDTTGKALFKRLWKQWESQRYRGE
ncbi:hypothetical protein IE53DRAFT_409922 [Violaceomyces palustris]|uniref:Uncharacterized protein n=1 Tax=Violaceomyces palustris TaxID=1673888 RepID=A0ACD0P198_9BASI|nr:hypothetical protein IE53DRAFT_409922 [Violaceomyces palustris]